LTPLSDIYFSRLGRMPHGEWNRFERIDDASRVEIESKKPEDIYT
jgi:hypothetical protein